MSDLVSFLLERIAEDEEAARAVEVWEEIPGARDAFGTVDFDELQRMTPEEREAHNREFQAAVFGPRRAMTDEEWSSGMVGMQLDLDQEVIAHTSRWSPARVLRECEAKRRIIEARQRIDGGDTADFVVGGGPEPGVGYAADALDLALRALALPYADRPGYDERWRPE